MKKILAAILSLTLLLSFTACAKKDEDVTIENEALQEENNALENNALENNALENIDKEAYEYVDNFLKALTSFDGETLSKYGVEEVKDIDIFELKKSILEGAEMDPQMQEAFEIKLIDPMFAKILDSFDYEIVKAEEKENETVFTVNINCIKFSQMQNAFSDEVLEEALVGLESNYSDITSEEELMKVMPEIIETIAETALNLLDNIDEVEGTITLSVEKTDGKCTFTENCDVTALDSILS